LAVRAAGLRPRRGPTRWRPARWRRRRAARWWAAEQPRYVPTGPAPRPSTPGGPAAKHGAAGRLHSEPASCRGSPRHAAAQHGRSAPGWRPAAPFALHATTADGPATHGPGPPRAIARWWRRQPGLAAGLRQPAGNATAEHRRPTREPGLEPP